MRSTGDFTGVIVAAGGSTRFGSSTPKQFAMLAGRSVLARSVRGLLAHRAVRDVVVVLSPDELRGPRADEVRVLDGVRQVVAGGDSRAESVRRGLAAVGESTYVLVHDAARPLLSPELLESVVTATRARGAAIPTLPVIDTVKRVNGDAVECTLERAALRLAQTPQGARLEILVAALDSALAQGLSVTDEASALEAAGHTVAAVEGDPRNIKITEAADLDRAAMYLGVDGMELRVGCGFDVHRVAKGRELVLAGVRFPGEPGLDGHSDADVLLHAAMDAVLGAAAMGDIGHWFPPEDEAFSGADSVALSRQVATMVAGRGFEIVNLDVTLLAERPKIRPHVDRMREAIASAFGISVERVGLKATTLEGLGALGRHEGMGAQAVALLRGGSSG